jgi:hypothetical protein
MEVEAPISGLVLKDKRTGISRLKVFIAGLCLCLYGSGNLLMGDSP